MTEQDKIEAEKIELNTLISKGLSFEVDRTVYKREKGFLGFFKKRVPEIEKLKFTIQEPTLSTLDRLSAEQIDLRIDESLISGESGISEVKSLAQKHSQRMARIIALAVLGQDYVISTSVGSSVRYSYDDQKLKELSELFYINIKPSKLIQLTMIINTASNLGDFLNSIRLMSASRTTIPIRIEENKEV
jgi:hypothetical protein